MRRPCPRPEGTSRSSRSHAVIVDDSESEDSDFLPVVKKKRGQCDSVLSSIKEDIHLIRQDIERLYKIDRHTRLPAALHRHLQDTFKCKICQNAPITPHVIFGRCCKSIIGCQTCVDKWYRGDEGMGKPCPLCGTPRALPDTMRIHGLDEFLGAIKPLLHDEQCPSE